MSKKEDEAGSVGMTAAQWLRSPYLNRAAVRLARQYASGSAELSDLLQELRIALWEKGLESRLSAKWLFRVGSNKAVDILRQRIRIRRGDRAFAGMARRSTGDPELAYLLEAKVAQLPRRLREVFDLYYRQGMSEREIARRLGLCRASVRWLKRCCLERISEIGAAIGEP